MTAEQFIDNLHCHKLYLVIDREGEFKLLPEPGRSGPSDDHLSVLKAMKRILIPWLVSQEMIQLQSLLIKHDHGQEYDLSQINPFGKVQPVVRKLDQFRMQARLVKKEELLSQERVLSVKKMVVKNQLKQVEKDLAQVKNVYD